MTEQELQRLIARPYLGYKEPLELARDWIRSRDPNQISDAVILLRGILKRYTHALAVGAELVLALQELKRDEEARAVLTQLKQQFSFLDEETLSRFGRAEKSRAFEAIDQQRWDDADYLLRQAIGHYREGYELRHNHYPGINLATCLLILALVAHRRGKADESRLFILEAQSVARTLLESAHAWPPLLPDDHIWFPATRGEIHLLLGEWEAAAKEYRRAMHEQGVLPLHIKSSLTQAKRLLNAWKQLGTVPDSPWDKPEEVIKIGGSPEAQKSE